MDEGKAQKRTDFFYNSYKWLSSILLIMKKVIIVLSPSNKKLVRELIIALSNLHTK